MDRNEVERDIEETNDPHNVLQETTTKILFRKCDENV